MEKSSGNCLLERLRLERQTALASGLFLPIFANPGFPALACRWVAAGERECRNFGIGNLYSLVGIARQKSHERAFQGSASHAVEDVAVDFAAIFLGDGYVAAIVERLFQRLAKFAFAGKIRDPALHTFVDGSGRYFEGLWINLAVGFGVMGRVRRSVAFGMRRSAHARVSSSCDLPLELICTSGLKACTGLVDSLSIASASESSYAPAK